MAEVRSRPARRSSRCRVAGSSQLRTLHIECAPGLMPRAALGALVAPLFVSLFRMGLLPGHALS
jgi:hypothetical protein